MTDQADVNRPLARSASASGLMRRSSSDVSTMPNVVIVVLDDLGFANFGCYGSDIATPYVDGLAERGLRYNSFHVTAICSASRACLLTGRNHHAVNMGTVTNVPLDVPGYSGRIPKSAATLARLLRDAGYNTFAVGKWHLTPQYEIGPAGPFDRWPLGMGFERFYGFLGGVTNQWVPDLVCDNRFVEPPASPHEGYHVTEDLASQAIRMVQDQQQAAPGKPFFLYFATGAVHHPHQVPTSWVEPYRNRFDAGWESYRREAFDRQLKTGLVPPGTMLTEQPPWVASWEDLPADERRLYARMMEVYAGFLTHTDAQIGRLVDFLASLGVLHNTIIVVISDNGASAEGGPHGMLNGQGDDVTTMLDRIDEFGGLRSHFNHYAWGWAWAGNTPFKLWKTYTWLGGVRAPLVVHWPAAIAEGNHGEVRGQFCHAIDLMPTILDAAGVDLPDVIDGVTQQPVDGRSLLGSFDQPDSPSPRDTQYFEMAGSRSIYHDGWKATTDHVLDRPNDRDLIEGSLSLDTDRWSLFNLDDDFSEAHDLADADPDQLQKMTDLWWYEAGRNQVLLRKSSSRLGVSPAYRSRHQFVALPGGGPIDTPPFHAGFCLTAAIELSGNRPAGIIAAQHNHGPGGSIPGGWACYFLDGRLVTTFNIRDTEYRTAIDQAIPAGRHDIQITYTSDNEDHHNAVSIALDGEQVHAQPVGSVPTSRPSPSLSAQLLIGHDHGFPICDDYEPPFAFTGHIHRVTLEFP